MFSALDVAFTALRITVFALVYLNEFLLLTSPWIIIPSHPPDAAAAATCPSTLFTTLTYAVSETVWAKLWPTFGWYEPWIIVLQLPPLFIWMAFALDVGFSSAVIKRRQLLNAHQDPREKATETDGATQQQQESYASSLDLFCAVHIPLQLALQAIAATNASLVGLVEDLGSNPDKYRAPGILGLTWFGLVIYLGCRWGDSLLCRSLFKAPSPKRSLGDICRAAVPYAVLQLACEASLRALLGREDVTASLAQLASVLRPSGTILHGLGWLNGAIDAFSVFLGTWGRLLLSVSGQMVGVYILRRADLR